MLALWAITATTGRGGENRDCWAKNRVEVNLRLLLVILLSLGLAWGLAKSDGRVTLACAFATAVGLYLWSLGLAKAWHAADRRRYLRLVSLGVFGAGLAIYGAAAIWLLRPDLLPQRMQYDFIANRQVTERLVDPALFKVEQWEIQGQSREVLFAHPAASGSTALVYPVKVEPRTFFVRM